MIDEITEKKKDKHSNTEKESMREGKVRKFKTKIKARNKNVDQTHNQKGVSINVF